MTYDLDEMVKFDNKNMTLFTAVRAIVGVVPAVRRHPGLQFFRDHGRQPETLNWQTSKGACKAALGQWKEDETRPSRPLTLGRLSKRSRVSQNRSALHGSKHLAVHSGRSHRRRRV
jgi:hypothetical protein